MWCKGFRVLWWAPKDNIRVLFLDREKIKIFPAWKSFFWKKRFSWFFTLDDDLVWGQRKSGGKFQIFFFGRIDSWTGWFLLFLSWFYHFYVSEKAPSKIRLSEKKYFIFTFFFRRRFRSQLTEFCCECDSGAEIFLFFRGISWERSVTVTSRSLEKESRSEARFGLKKGVHEWGIHGMNFRRRICQNRCAKKRKKQRVKSVNYNIIKVSHLAFPSWLRIEISPKLAGGCNVVRVIAFLVSICF